MSNEQSIRDEMASALRGIHEAGNTTWLGDANALLASPVIRRIQAEALREHGRVVAYWERGHSSKVLSHSVERIVADLEDRAAAIEQNSEGNET